MRAFVAGPRGVRGIAYESARAAGYLGSDAVLHVTGSRLLRRPRVAEAIRRKLDAVDAKANRILEELAHVAFAGARDADAAMQALKAGRLGDLPDHVAQAVSQVEIQWGKHGPTYRVKLHDKVSALITLAKIRRVVAERHELTRPAGRPVEMAVTFYLPESPPVVRAETVETAPAR